MSCATKFTQLFATLIVVTTALLSCGVQTAVRGQGPGRTSEVPKAPLPKPHPHRHPSPTPPKDTAPPKDNVGELISQGIKLNQQGDHNGAIDKLTEAITLERKRPAAYYNRGNAFYDKGDYDTAIGDYTDAIELDHGYDDAYYGRGRAKSSKKDFDGAIADYTKAIELESDFADAYRERGFNTFLKNIGKNMASDGPYNEGLDDLSEAIRLDPNDATVYFYRGFIYSLKFKEDSEPAIAELIKAIRLDPKLRDAYQLRGGMYYAKGDYDHAISDFTDVITLGAAPMIYYSRGELFFKKGQYKRAIDDLSEFIRLDPDLSMIGYDLRAQANERLGQNDLATADRQKAEQLRGNRAPQPTPAVRPRRP